MGLNREQLEILQHTAIGAARGLYCGDSPDMRALVSEGMMESAGCKSFVADEYFRLTAKGKDALHGESVKRG